MRLRSGFSAALGAAGCCGVGLGCLVPYAQVCDVPVMGCPPNFHPSLLHDEYNRISWLVAEPALAIAFSLVAVLLLTAAGLEARTFAGGMLVTAGVPTFAFFVGLYGIAGLPWAAIGTLVGALGGFLIAMAGVAAATAVLREGRSRAG